MNHLCLLCTIRISSLCYRAFAEDALFHSISSECWHLTFQKDTEPMAIAGDQAAIVRRYLWGKEDIAAVRIGVLGSEHVGKRSILQRVSTTALHLVGSG